MFKKAKEPELVPTPSVDPSKILWTLPLKEAARRSDIDDWCIPSPISKAIQYIESQEKFLSSEGIYRIPGSTLKVQAWREKFDRGEDVQIGTTVPWEVDEATSLIINFLKHMPESLFLDKKEQLKEAAKTEDLATMSKLLSELPLENRETLRLMIKHLAKVATYHDKNKMDARTLSLCFGPSFAVIFPPLINNADTIIPETKVFGVTYAEAAKRSDPQGLLPSPLAVSMQLIEEHGLSEKMIYQESGSYAKIKEYRYRFNSGVKVVYDKGDAHCATGIISTFFRDATDSLFTKELKQQFLEVKDIQGEDAKVAALKQLIAQLPEVNRCIVATFSQHLAKVAASPKNDMNAASIAVCLGPTFSVIFEQLINLASRVFA